MESCLSPLVRLWPRPAPWRNGAGTIAVMPAVPSRDGGSGMNLTSGGAVLAIVLLGIVSPVSAQQRMIKELTAAEDAIVWKEGDAMSKGSTLIRAGVHKTNPSLLMQLIACLARTWAITSSSPISVSPPRRLWWSTASLHARRSADGIHQSRLTIKLEVWGEP